MAIGECQYFAFDPSAIRFLFFRRLRNCATPLLRNDGLGLRRLRHILDEAEVTFPFQGMLQMRDPETGQTEPVRAADAADEYRKSIKSFREKLDKSLSESRIDYVPLDTSMPYDKALMEYLLRRRNRF